MKIIYGFLISLLIMSSVHSQGVGEVKQIFQADGKGMTIIINNDSDFLFKKDENGKMEGENDEELAEEKNIPVIPNFAKLVSLKNYIEIENKLQSGFSPNFILFEGNTALHMAAMWGDSRLMDLLLKYKANSNLSNNKGETPLHWTCARKNLDNIKVLLFNTKTQQIQLSKKTKNGMTCMHFASIYDTSTKDSINLLMSFKPDLKIKDSRGQNPAHYLAALSRWSILLEILKNDSVDIKEKDSFGNSIQDYIVNKSDIESKMKFYKYLPEDEKIKIKQMMIIHKHLSIKE